MGRAQGCVLIFARTVSSTSSQRCCACAVAGDSLFGFDRPLPPDQVRGFAMGRAQGCCFESQQYESGFWIPVLLTQTGKAGGRGGPYISSCPGRRPGIQWWPGVGWALAHRDDGWWAEAHPTRRMLAGDVGKPRGRTLMQSGEGEEKRTDDHPGELVR